MEKRESKKRKRQADHCAAMRAKKLCLLSEESNATELESTLIVDETPTSTKRPVLRSSLPYEKLENIHQSYVVNIGILTELLQKCQYCDKGPMDLANVCEEVRSDGLIPLLKVKCSHCNSINTLRPAESHRTGVRGRAALDINSRAGLAALHTGIGHTHYSGLLSTLGLPSLTSRNFKKREREAGACIENVAKRSCTEYTESEKQLSAKSNEEEQVVGVGVSYDMGWRKRGKSYDSSSGVGTAVGLKTGKILNYATRNTMCRICKEAINCNKELVAHDCRKNHQGSSKSMEANVAVQLFTDAVEQDVCYSTYVGDDDSTTESRLNTLVTYDVEKWSDINHSSRTLGSRLYAVKSKVKGLNPTIIAYFQRCFTYSIKQNVGQPSSLLEGLSSIVPHAFGEHNFCKDWCKYKEDPLNYRHGDLPGGKDLKVIIALYAFLFTN